MLIFDEHHLRQVLAGYSAHYNTARPHRAPQMPAAPNITSSRPGPWQNPASTDPRRTHQRVRGRSLKPQVRRNDRVLEPLHILGDEGENTRLTCPIVATRR